MAVVSDSDIENLTLSADYRWRRRGPIWRIVAVQQPVDTFYGCFGPLRSHVLVPAARGTGLITPTEIRSLMPPWY
jgi:hypothetical protein